MGNKQFFFSKHPPIWVSDNNNSAILGYPHKKARKKSFLIFQAWDFFLVIVHMLMNSKKAKKLPLQFVPMFTTFWLKCPGLDIYSSLVSLRAAIPPLNIPRFFIVQHFLMVHFLQR